MPCKRTDLGGGTVSWSCSRGERPPVELCEICRAKPRVYRCEFALRGAKSGQFCGRHMCAKCAVERNDSYLCPPHAKFTT